MELSRDETFVLSLTGLDSHRLVRSPGVGSVVIGPAAGGSRRPDLVVAADDAIDWTVFDPLKVPAGYPWPRLPFSAWPAGKAKKATTAYRAAQRAIATATGPAGVEAAIRAFVAVVNAMPGIETPDREDAGEAVFQLAADTPFGDLTEDAQHWFDDARDF